MDIDTVRWIIGGLFGVIAALIAVIFSRMWGELKASAYFRHHTFVQEVARIDGMLLDHQFRITKLEGK